MSKPILVMLAAHEPNLDPRIKWEATTASKDYDLTLIGIKDSIRVYPEREKVDDHIIIRTDRKYFIDANFKYIIFSLFSRAPLFLLTLITFRGISHFLDWMRKSPYALWRVKQICAFLKNKFKSLVIKLLRCLPRPIKTRLKTIKEKLFVARPVQKTISSSATNNSSPEKNNPEEPKNRGIKAVIFNKLIAANHNIRSRYIHCMLWMTNYLLSSAFVLVNFAKENFKYIDTIHCNDFDSLLAGVILKRHYKCRLVYDAHEFWPKSIPQMPYIGVKFLMAMEGFLIKYVDRVITVNPLLAKEIAKSYRLPYVESIPNAEPWNESSDKPVRAVGEEVIFLFQGGFAAERGLQEFVEAWCRVKPNAAKLYLRGPASSARNELEDQVKKSGIDSIIFLPSITEDKLVEEARFADIGLIPYRPVNINYRYCCPNKLSQYMHAGLAILSNDLPYVRSVIEENNVGLLYNSDRPETIDSAIRTIIADKAKIKSMKESALYCARTVFNWQQYENRLLDSYKVPVKMI